MYTTIIENGEFNFKLKNILNNKKISINKLMRDTNTDYKVIKRLITGEITKIDLFVIARLCNYLDCNLNDLISYTNKKIPQMN
ncbi:helix-turn-helix domain-containing protein [Thomasclavelia cocleata]|uniref:helix-turn-helix domain-containing protein n=1 Tax=Thomasclavelia cocleata TaxID=69824 RepID=UPI002625D341|nr:helix-turn-helix transcriptional regulator [Thomasclavelia cocleata]